MALSWINGYNNIDYLNKMIRNVENTLSNDYNDLDNIPIIKIVSSTSEPQNIWELKEGMYLIDGIIYVDNNTSYEVSNLFVSMTARLENSKYVLSAFIPFFKGLYEYILKSNSTEYEEHQIVILATHEKMLTRYNETPYEPKGDYNPATKKYVDDKANEIITELDNMGVNKETTTSLKEKNRIRDIKLQALLNETSDRNISISEDTHYFDMPLSIDEGLVRINEIVGDTLVNVCDQEEPIAVTKGYTVENEHHIPLQGEYDGKCRPIVYGNTLVNHNADWDGNLQTGVETSASGIEDVQVEGIKGQEVSVVVEGNTVLNHALGKTSAVASSVEDNLITKVLSASKNIIFSNGYVERLNDQTETVWKFDASLFKPNTIYTVYYDIIINTLDCRVTLINNTNMGRKVIQTGFVGSESYTFTTSDTPHYCIEGWLDNIYVAGDLKFYIKIYEGDHTTNPKYVNSNNGNYVDLTVANDMSSVVEIEGRTMVNVCDQKDPIAITKSYTVENSGNHITLQGEYDGSCRPVIQGNTMVNLIPNLSFRQNQTSQGQQWVYKYYTLNQPTKANTVYTLIFDVIENTAEVTELSVGGKGKSFELISIPISGTGRYIIAATSTDETYDHSLFFIQFQDIYGIGTFEARIMIFEGDLTQTPELIPTEYVEGLKSSFEDNLVSVAVGKNIFMGKCSMQNIASNGNNASTNNDTRISTDYILVEPNTTYTVSFTGNSSIHCAYMYDRNKEFIKYDDTSFTFTTTNETCYIRYKFYGTSLNDITNIQIEKGSTSTSYEEPVIVGKYKVEYKVIGKNKFDMNNIERVRFATAGNSAVGEVTHMTTVNGNHQYAILELPEATYSWTIPGGDYFTSGWSMLVYESDTKEVKIGNAIEAIGKVYFTGNATKTTFTCKKRYQFIQLAYTETDITDKAILGAIQIEEGTEATEYEPYKSYTKTFYLNSPLLEGDTIEDINGVATHVKRYGKVVLDGSSDEGWKTTTKKNNYTRCIIENFAKVNLDETQIQTINNSLPDVTFGNIYNLDVEGVAIAQTGNLAIKLADNRFSNTTNFGDKEYYSAFIAWLQANPVTVVYPLASPQYEPISTESILCDSYINGHLDFDSAVPIEKVRFREPSMSLKYLKPNTNYTIQFESDSMSKTDAYFFMTTRTNNINVVKGTNKFNMTTSSTIQEPILYFDGIGFNASNIVVTEATDADFDYFEGLSSSYESCYPGGKNLFKEENLIMDTYYQTNGVPRKDIGTTCIKVENINPNLQYKVSGNNLNRLEYWEYDKKGNFLSHTSSNISSPIILTNSNTDNIIVKVAYYENNSTLVSNIQLEEGSTATSYEPFIDKYKVDVKVTGKNLWNGVQFNKEIYSDTGAEVDKTTFRVTDFISVSSDRRYSYDAYLEDGTRVTTSTRWYDKDKKYIGYGGDGTTPIGASYVRLRASNLSGLEDKVVFMISEINSSDSNKNIPYEPYFESTKTFYLNSPLLEGDRLVTKNGKIYHYHKMGRVVLDGSENWTDLTYTGNNVLCYEISNGCPSDFKDGGILYSDTKPRGSERPWIGEIGLAFCRASQHGLYAGFATADEGRAWIKNPTTVVYELAKPYYELIDEYNNTILNIPKNVAHLTHTSAVPVNNTVFTNYKDELNVLEPNTQYRVMFDCDTASIPFTVTLGGTSQTVTSKKGTHSLLITTPSALVDKNLVIDGIGRCGIDNIRIFKGTVEYDYVKGLWSGYEERKLEPIPLIRNSYDSTLGSRVVKISDNLKKSNFTIITNVLELTAETGVRVVCRDTSGYQRYRTLDSRGVAYYNLPGTLALDLSVYIESNDYNKGQLAKVSNILVLEGDWTDNPPTYEEVMANEGKYAVKVKLDTNATIFGKGGRL